ncbi:MAG TPA: histidine phosphatase family protein [Chitinispirillaceae bacterium]|nr:histidine phosphatase family protein [Chitinispirillaceae bacterium]
MDTTFLLIRHGDIEMADRVPGRLPGVYLSAHGSEQALDIVSILEGITINAIYSSPLDRTIETALPLASVRGLSIIPEDAFTEVDDGEWTGMRFDELENDPRWRQFHTFRNGCIIPGGELMIEVQSRMVGKLMDLQEIHPGKTVAIFSHNDPIKSALAFFLGVSLDLFLRIRIDTGSTSVLVVSPNSTCVKGVNLTHTLQLGN